MLSAGGEYRISLNRSGYYLFLCPFFMRLLIKGGFYSRWLLFIFSEVIALQPYKFVCSCFNSNVFSFNRMFFLCEMCFLCTILAKFLTEETRTILENSEGIHEFIPITEERYNLDDEPVFTGANIEHLVDKNTI